MTGAAPPERPAVVWPLASPPDGREQVLYVEGGPAHRQIQRLVHVGRAAGYHIPDYFFFLAGQVFFDGYAVQEIRLAGFTAGPEAGPPRATWTTSQPPNFTRAPDGRLVLDSQDAGRAHLSILAYREPGSGQVAIAMLWDLGPKSALLALAPAARCPRLDLVEVANSLIYHEFRQSLGAGPQAFAVPAEGKWPTADLASPNRRLLASAQLRPCPKGEDAHLTRTQLEFWQDRMAHDATALDDLTADVLDIVTVLWLRRAKHPGDMILLSADDCLRLRGLQPQKSGSGRRGGYKEEWRRDIARQIAILSRTWITVGEMAVTLQAEGQRGSRRKRGVWRGESTALVVSSRFGQVTTAGAAEACAWLVRPGDVFARFLFGPGRQTALLAQRALAYDPYRHKWEKRLARYLAYLWRVRQGQLEPLAVATVLQALRQEIDRAHPERTRRRLEQALDRLQDDGVLADWRYTDGYEDHFGEKGWREAWCRACILIEPPRAVLAQYARIEAPGGRKVALLPERCADEPPTWRQIRQARGLTQLQAAEQIGISQAELSLVESGKKSPGPATRKKLKRWLKRQQTTDSEP